MQFTNFEALKCMQAKAESAATMSNPRAAFGSAEGFVRPSLGFRCSKSILYSDNLSLF